MGKAFKKLDEAPIAAGTRVLMRTDFNVPVRAGKVFDDFRIRKTLPTLEFLKGKGAVVVAVSHIENEAGNTDRPTLRPIAAHLSKLGFACDFAETIEEAGRISMEKSKAGKFALILLENVRGFKGETSNDPAFAERLAALGDIYVNDAFSSSHREHASIVGAPGLMPGYAGLLFADEVANLSTAFNPPHPFLFILGGAKFDTKLPLVTSFAQKADATFIGGALANDFFKAKGYEVGRSSVSTVPLDFDGLLSNPRVMLPADVIADAGGKQMTLSPDRVAKDQKILDAGPAALVELGKKVAEAKYILWNGPLGNYENGYKEPTHELARMVAEATARGTQTIIGGGDTLAAIAEIGGSFDRKFTFVSTGGGAMLDFLAKGTLPGIEALSSSGS